MRGEGGNLSEASFTLSYKPIKVIKVIIKLTVITSIITEKLSFYFSVTLEQ
ncbi:MAG: hypothetical protein BWY67_00994 [Bacteroidetes bacterium ADurb.Bin397]|jgi:hypothetical protein|nr:MAG: hypothetical protein BWY67_00994 [Bacteroidetes bacterium ADurb.Bin397]